VLTFVLDRAGRVLSVSVVRSSGDRSFDDAALAMMRRADPVPAPPPRIADSGLSFTLPIVFRAKARN
jgi:periplasmic protein TonB